MSLTDAQIARSIQKERKTKAKAKKKAAAPPDEFDEMNLEQLQEALKISQARTQELKRNRNYYQQERDQVQGFYDITHDEVTKTEAHVKNIEHQMERMQAAHREDIRLYLQKVIHLEYEHVHNVDTVNTEGAKQRAEEEAKHHSKKGELKSGKLQLKQDLKDQESSYEEEVKNLREVERKELQKLREEFDRNHRELESKYETRLRGLRDDLELRRKMEIHEIEERKNRHINDLMKNHEKAFAEMKGYYNNITQDNLALIKTLNDDIEQLKLAHIANQKDIEKYEAENAKLAEPLAAAEAEVEQLQLELLHYEKDKVSLKHAKARLLVLEDQYKSMMEEHKQLQERYTKVEGERDTLYSTFEETVIAVQKRSQAKNEILEKMLEEYKDISEVKKAQFRSVLAAANVDTVVLEDVTRRLDDVLTAKNDQINELKYETARVTKAHNDLVRVYDAKLAKLGIPKNELSLEPLVGSTTTAPADLIA